LVDDIDAGGVFAVDAVVPGAFPEAAGRKRIAEAVLPCVNVAVTTGGGGGIAFPDGTVVGLCPEFGSSKTWGRVPRL